MGRGAALLSLACVVAVVLSSPQIATGASGHDGRIFFSDDDRHLASNLYSVNPNGKDRKRLTHPGRMDDGSPAVSPNGRRIAFDRYVFTQSDYRSSIWTMRPDGSDQKRLTSRDGAADSPSFSPDGRQIVYEQGSDIFVMDANGDNRKRVTNNGSRTFDSDPVFSPDGSRIAFERDAELWSIRPNGRGFKRLAKKGAYPQYSPDGKRITFSVTQNGPGDTVWVMDANGGHRKKLGPGQDSVFSADGKKIAYTGSGASATDANVSVMRANGSRPRHLTSGCCPGW